MKFIEFTEKETGNLHYFIGISNQSILAATRDGNSYGGLEFESFRSVPQNEVEELNPECLTADMEAIKRGCQSYKLHIPLKTQHV